jgi:hypothetical protein
VLVQLGQVAEDAASNGVCYPEFVETGKKSASSEIKTSTRTGIRMFCNGAGEAFVDVMLMLLTLLLALEGPEL